MSKIIRPSDSFVDFLISPERRPAPDHIKKLLQKYRITHFLGAGGFADVYEGTGENGWSIAIKVPQFKMKKTMDSSTLKRFTTEAEMWTKLQHDNIVQVYNTGSKPLPHIVMELMEGGDLENLMKDRRLTMEEAVYIIIQILEGLSHAHRMATVHRDLKPENILFTHDGIAKITDWGIGKYMASEGITKTIETKGTLAYSAPEQFDSQEYGKVDWQTDIFQAGILFYEMLTGVKPFQGKDMAEVMGKVLRYDPTPPSSLNSNVPAELDEIVMDALEKYKKDRWDSSAVMLHELKLIIKGKVRIERRDRKAEKAIHKARKQIDILDELYQYAELLGDLNVDIEQYKNELKTVEEYAKLRWYDKVRETGTPLLDELKDKYDKAAEERRAPLRPMIASIRSMFEECITRKIDVDDLYSLNEEAMDAFEKMDLKRSEDQFDKLRIELEGKVDIPRRKEKAWNIYNSLESNSYGVAPPPNLKSLIEHDVKGATPKLREWKEAVEERKIEHERKKEIQKRYKNLKKISYLFPPIEYNGLLDMPINKAEKILREWENEINKHNKEIISKRSSEWKNNKFIVNVSTKIYQSGFFREKKVKMITDMECCKNFMRMLFIKIPDRDYYISNCTVTQIVWKTVMGTQPWKDQLCVREGSIYPATYVSWNDCQEFVKKINEMEGTDRYRLPTEDEWEHACLAGSRTKYYFGDDIEKLHRFAWYISTTRNIEEYAHEVCQKLPNQWGLYDMHGNVWEWTSTINDLHGVSCGGSGSSDANNCKASSRSTRPLNLRSNVIGFRLLREGD